MAVVTDRTAYVAFPVFNTFAEHGNLTYRLLVRNLLDQLIEPIVSVGGPSYIETTLQRQKGRMILHVLAYQGERRAPGLDLIEDIVPLYDVPVSVKVDKKPARVYLAPSRKELAFEYVDGRVRVTLPEVRGHEMVVMEER
jgi:hypothetical protein